MHPFKDLEVSLIDNLLYIIFVDDVMYNSTRFMIDSDIKGLLSDLQTLVRQPSISSKKEGLEECANLVSNIMRKSGIYSTVFYYDTSTPYNRKSTIPPIVYGEVKSKSNPNGNTLLFYNHYDVQPVEPIDRWEVNPFGGEIKDGKIYGRGAADDKGELITRIKAAEYLLRERGDVPCNIKFFVEGEEEVGSPHIASYLQKFRQRLACDGIIWEFGYVDTQGRPIINLGMKGMLYVELVSRGLSHDLHSSLAVLVRNPIWNMVKALNTIWDDKNAKILIKDWYNEVKEFTADELAFIQHQPLYDIDEFAKKYRINRFLKHFDDREGIKRVLAGAPTCNISGIDTGYIIQGAKTVIPALAKVKIDFRLVPNMNPELQFQRLRAHLREKGFSDIETSFIHGVSASRTSFKHPFVKILKNTAEKVYRKRSIVNLSSAGSGPMSIFVNTLKCPCVAAGCTSIFSNIHGPNEYADIGLLKKGTILMMEIIRDFSR
jgi:acetylornithine deacetylase/succinyl-diaminopimelate desuccinylase-like protein